MKLKTTLIFLFVFHLKLFLCIFFEGLTKTGEIGHDAGGSSTLGKTRFSRTNAFNHETNPFTHAAPETTQPLKSLKNPKGLESHLPDVHAVPQAAQPVAAVGKPTKKALDISKEVLPKIAPEFSQLMLHEFQTSSEFVRSPANFYQYFLASTTVEEKMEEIRLTFSYLNQEKSKFDQEYWASAFRGVMKVKDGTQDLRIEAEMYVQLSDSDVYALRNEILGPKDLEAQPYAQLRGELARGLKKHSELTTRVDVFDDPVDNPQKILKDEAATFFKKHSLNAEFETMTSTTSTFRQKRMAWLKVAVKAVHTNTRTFEREKIAAASLLCYTFELALKGGVSTPQAKEAIDLMEIVNTNYLKDFTGLIKDRMKSTFGPYRKVKFLLPKR
ncbi:hypothetical protein O181_011592 [Austropuccinia psidii MF-1]|uniref:Uncharacterized protein n=1 Tax=Austropuccinia psidii MF-1 TaxID=1389203 RepID=A0A9Q3BUT1_9BASI|nr:hypothetical protein [Austropuccinia psidii MF-1]